MCESHTLVVRYGGPADHELEYITVRRSHPEGAEVSACSRVILIVNYVRADTARVHGGLRVYVPCMLQRSVSATKVLYIKACILVLPIRV